jgi:hypothetical protein
MTRAEAETEIESLCEAQSSPDSMLGFASALKTSLKDFCGNPVCCTHPALFFLPTFQYSPEDISSEHNQPPFKVWGSLCADDMVKGIAALLARTTRMASRTEMRNVHELFLPKATVEWKPDLLMGHQSGCSVISLCVEKPTGYFCGEFISLFSGRSLIIVNTDVLY